MTQIFRFVNFVGCLVHHTIVDYFIPNMSSYSISIFLIGLILSGPVFAQHALTNAQPSHLEAGIPFIQNFSPKEYGAHSQNWAIVQDRRGVMYFGNSSGVLEYDGVSWRLIPVTNGTVVRSLVMDATGRIYVGTKGEFGYLAENESGKMQYVSLLHHVNQENRDFSDVWQVYTTSHGAYFRTDKYLFRWVPDEWRKPPSVKRGPNFSP